MVIPWLCVDGWTSQSGLMNSKDDKTHIVLAFMVVWLVLVFTVLTLMKPNTKAMCMDKESWNNPEAKSGR